MNGWLLYRNLVCKYDHFDRRPALGDPKYFISTPALRSLVALLATEDRFFPVAFIIAK